MSYQVIARKYRPQRFADIVGQEHITRTLQNAVIEGRLHHGYLFTGIRGIGKTTLARIFSKILNCKAPVMEPMPEPCNKCSSCIEITNGSSINVQEIDGASNNSVEDVREIRERVKYLPSNGKYKIYIIDEVHMLSGGAFNALLKTLEEPPEHVIFIFATTEAQKIPATILSRCQRYDFRRITTEKIMEVLEAIARSEGVEAEKECLGIIASEAEGSLRDAESLLDQAIAFSGKKLTYEHLKSLLGFIDKEQITRTVRAVIEKDAAAALAVADELFAGGENLNRFALALLERFHDLLILKTCKELPRTSKLVDIKGLKELEPKVTVEECQQLFNAAYRGAEDISRTKFPKVVLDVLLITLAQIRPVKPIDELIEKVELLQRNYPSVVSPPQQAQKAETLPERPGPRDRHIASALTSANGEQQATGLDWGSFTDWLKLNKPQMAHYLDNALGGSLTDSTLSVRFETRSFASESLLEADRRSFMEKLASDFFKRPVKLVVEFDEPDKDHGTKKKKDREELLERHRRIKEEALQHETIRGAANIFGAEIKEVKIK